MVNEPSRALRQALQDRIDNKTKPPGALGRLEEIALQVGLVQQSLNPVLNRPVMLLFAGDHGIALEGVSPYPQAVTAQMVGNFVNGGAAINVFCRQHGIAIEIVDAGVNADLSSLPILHKKIAMGTRSFLQAPAMSEEEFLKAMAAGACLVEQKYKEGSNVIGFGEMGIGNTSSAALVFSVLSGIPLDECIGRGTGLDDEGLRKKKAILHQALDFHKPDGFSPQQVLQVFGGFELVMICGAIIEAAACGMLILIDGFIVTAALVAAVAMEPAVKSHCVYTHLSDEHAHKLMLDYLGGVPLVSLNMRLGEGSGVAVTYPLVESAVLFLRDMASFEDAGVSQSE
ncbi:MAG: nicotinate-nucleotide--dimethylbenzimidazole phosphoribosyltransferase [Pseudomonadales bacterium]|nr:nicotinate-nucleotide--dimethylbenzimidazole phosphoribosyltransferase [Pseudomonadales bacterium]